MTVKGESTQTAGEHPALRVRSSVKVRKCVPARVMEGRTLGLVIIGPRPGETGSGAEVLDSMRALSPRPETLPAHGSLPGPEGTRAKRSSFTTRLPTPFHVRALQDVVEGLLRGPGISSPTPTAQEAFFP